jgi:hypothetical protein
MAGFIAGIYYLGPLFAGASSFLDPNVTPAQNTVMTLTSAFSAAAFGVSGNLGSRLYFRAKDFVHRIRN